MMRSELASSQQRLAEVDDRIADLLGRMEDGRTRVHELEDTKFKLDSHGEPHIGTTWRGGADELGKA
jgi:hypothetical protein